jgi:hypothetical protein
MLQIGHHFLRCKSHNDGGYEIHKAIRKPETTGTGHCCSLASNLSAAGQLEHPSDVNSSKSTGTAGFGSMPEAAATIPVHQPKNGS